MQGLDPVKETVVPVMALSMIHINLVCERICLVLMIGVGFKYFFSSTHRANILILAFSEFPSHLRWRSIDW
jgi:predicted exporter